MGLIDTLSSWETPFEEIKQEMKEIYLRDSLEWCVMVSFGKDSSLTLLLIWEMLQSLKPEQRFKKVGYSDYLVEKG